MGLYECLCPIWGAYIRPGLICDLGLYSDRFDISGEILQKISKTLYFIQNVEKNLLHVIFVKINRFDHVSDDIPVASFAVDFVRAWQNYSSARNSSSSDCCALCFFFLYFYFWPSFSTVTSMSPPSTHGLCSFRKS